MNDTNIDYKELTNYLFYCLCHFEGNDSAIQLLVEGGYDPNQLEGLDFNKKF